MLQKYAEKYRLRLGFLPTRRNVFDPVEAGRFKNLIYDQIKGYNIDIFTLDGLNEEGLLYDVLDADRAAELLIREKVDAVFAPHCNFGTEAAVAKACKKIGKPVLLWGPLDDPANELGFRKRDSQCGLFATSKALLRYGVPFTYVTNSAPDSRTFHSGFENFLSVAAVVKAFRSARIGQVDTRPETFLSVMYNESELLEKFGIEVVPVSLVTIAGNAKSIIRENSDAYRQALDDFRQRFDNRCLMRDSLEKAAGLKVALEQWADEKGVTAIGMQCWDALQEALGIYPCFVNGILTDEGLPVACETDITGALSISMLQAAARGRTPAFLADLTVRHPGNNNAELLWHCGNFPASIAKTERIVGQQCEGPLDAAGRWEIEGGDITIAKMDGIGGQYSLLMGHARGCAGPVNSGTYIWAEFENWPRWERKIIYGPYIHHVGVIHGCYAPVLYEACRYIPGLVPDPVEPSKEEIEEVLLFTSK